MALIPVQGLWMPEPPPALQTIGFSSALVIDATGEKIGIIGPVWNKDRATKNITKVGFRFGTVTKAGGSGLTVSLQNVDTATGPPFQADGTQDQTVAIANGNAAFASNTWIQTAALSATRSVAFGEMLAVVIEYDGSGRLGADSVVVSAISLPNASNIDHTCGASLFTASWAVQTVIPDILLEFDDGTFGTLGNSLPLSAINTHSFNSGSTPDEHALEFTLPFPCNIEGAWAYVGQAGSAANLSLTLYNGTTEVGSFPVDANAVDSGNVRVVRALFPEVAYAIGDTFRLAVRPTTANNVTAYSFDVGAANHLQAHAGGTSWNYTTRTDGGAWAAAITTRRLFGGIRISAIDDGAGGAAAPVGQCCQ